MSNRGSIANFRAKPETVDRKESIQGSDRDAWIYFHDADSEERVLITHGTRYGIWPKESEEALQKHPDATVIYCCHPLLMKQSTMDLRIQGRYRGKLSYVITFGSKYDYISVVVNDEKDND